MTNSQGIELYNALAKGEFSNLKGVKFNYALIRNQNILKRELSTLDKSIEFKPEYKEFEEKRISLLKKYASLDEKGNPIIKNKQYVLDSEKETEFNTIFEELKSKYTKVIDDRSKDIEEYEELLERDISFEIHKIKLSDIPEDITKRHMDMIIELIEE